MDTDINSYVSCIKIGKEAIIPPLLTEQLRSEMRYYRDLAVSLEKRRKMKRPSTDSGVMTSSADGSCIKKLGISTEILPSNNLIHSVNDHYQKLISSIESLEVLEKNDADDPFKQQRRNSYTLENPSPVLIEYISKKSDNKWKLFIDPENDESCSNQSNKLPEIIVLLENLCNETAKKDEKLTLEDLEIDFAEPERNRTMMEESGNEYDLFESKSSNVNEFSNFSEQNEVNSVPSSSRASPVSVIDACRSAECLKRNVEFFNNVDDVTKQSKEVTPVNRSWQFVNNSCDNMNNNADDFTKEFDLSAEHSTEKDNLYHYLSDSFNKDFHVIDSSNSMNISRDSDVYQESRCSDCSSVSLSKFLSQDMKLLDGQEAEYMAFSYMKEQLEKKHRIQLAILLKEQQKEHDNLKIQFNRITSMSKSSCSPMSNYAYSQDIVLKKYSPSERNSSTAVCVKAEHCEEPKLNQSSTPKKLTKSDDFRRKINLAEKNNFRDSDDRVKAATKINAAVRGYLIRRLFKSDRVTLLVQTIKDCLITAVSLQNESNLGLSELDLQSRILQQLTVACNELHDIFSLPVDKRIAIIAADREKKDRLLWKKNTTPLPLSDATKRTLQRKNITNSAPSGQRKYIRKRWKSGSSSTSESNSCRSTPGYRRPITRKIISQKYAISQNRRAWR